MKVESSPGGALRARTPMGMSRSLESKGLGLGIGP